MPVDEAFLADGAVQISNKIMKQRDGHWPASGGTKKNQAGYA
jgi:hypothetical protein